MSRAFITCISDTGAIAMDIYHSTIDVARNPRHTRWLSPLLLAGDTLLCVAIIWKIPCVSLNLFDRPHCSPFAPCYNAQLLISESTDTEIDWAAYMQQIVQYRSGERDYTLIKGQTGPLVYPAGYTCLGRTQFCSTDAICSSCLHLQLPLPNHQQRYRYSSRPMHLCNSILEFFECGHGLLPKG